MAINLEKGNGICLDKGLSRVAFTVSWDTSEDVDISAMLLEKWSWETRRRLRILP